ncbi:hypothetical protein GCM10010145_34960 [Streptomyces ruber]|uniref:DUF3558 domain-containing protein n=2 Tax=Streptomyces TaxID=1883 RepID=A0A918ETA8_9ACTN|nr:hypothetical protein [Streptomyces ruber]GGQ62094.1 hypothetical protein GCM10010145_34960 [Streptomyces ruber]
MHRSAQRDQQHQRVEPAGRAGRPGGSARGRRLLVAATAVPVLLMASACSSDSGSGAGSGSGGDAKDESSASASPTPSASAVQAAAYGKLPDTCSVLSEKTLKDLVPEGAKSGKAISEGQPDVSGDCRWTSLADNGVDGSQYRWLSVSLLRLDSDEARGPGEERAAEQYEKKIGEAKSVDGAKNVRTEQVGGTGDQATLVRYDLKKDEGDFRQQTVVVRAENVVITLDYNGAGLAGDKTPDADDLSKDAKAAAKEVVTAVAEANEAGSGSPSAPASTDKPDAGSGSAIDKDSGSGSGSDSGSDSGSSGRKS